MISESLKIYNLYLEGAAEDMITSVLNKLNATPEEVNLFLQKENGKLLYKPEDVATLFKWIKEENADTRELADDYKNYQKFFPNVKLDQFKSYIDWTEKIHGKRDESKYQTRNKDLSDIDVKGIDKENVLADDEDVLILKGDNEHKCVRYGKGYSFCISRPYGGNMYGTYRIGQASTFHFVFFKKTPKEDDRHIMVLDRTNNGWKWTFRDNNTQEVEGGWDEVVRAFPVLAKYENLFVNKPLTKEEKDYQKQLSKFVRSPTKDKFDKFSYEQKADVLKFGMLIPINIFESLDKYLRNEWVSVGPKMNDNIYENLSTSEKNRFAKVREQQLTQREPEDKYDLEICKNNPELYDKHIKPDKEASLKYKDYILGTLNEEGVYYGDVSISTKYFLPPELSKIKEISSTLELFNFIGELDLPNLIKVGSIIAKKATTVNLPQLQKSGDIYARSATIISLPQLQQSGDIYASLVTSLSLPQLQKSVYVYAGSATSISLPKLQQSGDISADSATSIILPQLQQSGDIDARSATSLSLPQLQQSGYIYATSAKKIKISSKLKPHLRYVPDDCKIIEPSSEEELNDSVVYNLMKSFLLTS